MPSMRGILISRIARSAVSSASASSAAAPSSRCAPCSPRPRGPCQATQGCFARRRRERWCFSLSLPASRALIGGKRALWRPRAQIVACRWVSRIMLSKWPVAATQGKHICPLKILPRARRRPAPPQRYLGAVCCVWPSRVRSPRCPAQQGAILSRPSCWLPPSPTARRSSSSRAWRCIRKILLADARASLLIDGTDGLADPLTGGRLTLVGHARPTSEPDAQGLASWRAIPRHRLMPVSPTLRCMRWKWCVPTTWAASARIVDLAPADLLRPVHDAQALIAAEADIIAHMNADHGDAVALYATELAQCAAGDWRLVGVDPDGIDLLHRSNAARIEFSTRVRNPGEARAALVAMAKLARDRQGPNAS